MWLWNLNNKSKRAVSPVISSILMIALIIVAGVAVVIVMTNLDSSPTVETTHSAIGSLSNSNEGGIKFDLALEKSYYDLQIFYDEGSKFYTTLTLRFNYTGNTLAPDVVYVADADILMYGEKLDDASAWEIDNVVGAKKVYDDFNNLIGYEQARNTAALYTVSLIDTSVVDARLQFDTTFVYRLKVGNTPGIVEFVVENEEVSKLAFNLIKYNVSIIHYQQSIIDNRDPINIWKNLLIGNNDSRNIIYNYNDTDDLYDVDAGDLNGINITAFVEKYDIILFGEWGIHVDAAALAYAAKAAGLNMLFAGRAKDLIQDGVLDYTATADIIGIDPQPYGINEAVSLNTYSFNNTDSNLLINLQGVTVDPFDDRAAYDAASLSANSNATVYGIINYELYDSQQDADLGINVQFAMESVMLVATDANDTLGLGTIAAYIIDHRNAPHTNIVMQNMLLYSVNEPERIQLTTGFMVFDSIFKDVDRRNQGIHFTITSTVTGADLVVGSLNFTLVMDLSVPFTLYDYELRLYVGAAKIDRIPYSIVNNGTNFIIDISVGTLYPWDIPAGTQLILELARSGNFMETTRNTNTLNDGVVPWIFEYVWLDANNEFGSNSVTL